MARKPFSNETAVHELEILMALGNYSGVATLKEKLKYDDHHVLGFPFYEQRISLAEAVSTKGASIISNKNDYWSMMKQFSYEIGNTIKHCHKRGVIVCGLSPDNIAIVGTKDGWCTKFTDLQEALFWKDYNLSIIASGEDSVFEQSYSQHPKYRAPEVTMGFKIGYGIDVWSFGVLMFFMQFDFDLFDAPRAPERLKQIHQVIGPAPKHLFHKLTNDFGKNKNRDRLVKPVTSTKDNKKYFAYDIRKKQFNDGGYNREQLFKYFGKLECENSEDLYLLIKSLLNWDPTKRASIDHVLNGKYFVNRHQHMRLSDKSKVTQSSSQQNQT